MKTWEVEMTEPRYVYLHTYWPIDASAHRLGALRIHVKSPKYYHGAAAYCFSSGVDVAHGFVGEMHEGLLDPSWERSKKVS